ncbi:biotin/lipoate--protein ligase family protein [Aliiruegeria lutimaris]|uniref:Biotin-(Acetyl-CoA carboxylase) ligase n=1 Tax=Aliiruegeria lutimaris TaxID=571298 RepID=A0A1G9CZ03_9RHOB|nr:biotin/lipoate--protein ligase family protein [Aliiruegeria lutimaris]SDK56823.1 Biotin-(acetyl-CoA carboxylase) ligase [Aliiruegeria lutimaris]
MTPDLPVFPPLFHGHPVSGATDPFAKACAQALLGCDSGLVAYNIGADTLKAAIVLAPEMPLEQAMSAFIACGVGFQNALGALAPPEVAVHLAWDGGIRVNGAGCGRLRAAASTAAPAAHPDWLVVGLEILLLPTGDPSHETTSLIDEGCAEVEPLRLLEAWVRHTLVWLNTLEEDGNRPLHAQWQGIADGIGEDVTRGALSGRFLGTDEDFGMLLRTDDSTHVLPLSTILEGENRT